MLCRFDTPTEPPSPTLRDEVPLMYIGDSDSDSPEPVGQEHSGWMPMGDLGLDAGDLESLSLPQPRRPRRVSSLALGAASATAVLLGLVAAAAVVYPRTPALRSASGGEMAIRLAAAPAPPAISLFCFSIMKPHSGEQTLMEFALKRRTSIFKCDDFAVISSEKINLGPGDNGDVHTWYEPTPQVGTGQLGSNGVTTNSFLNTYSFIIAWNSLVKSGKLVKHDFVVKADPDAVFLPDRLGPHVIAHKGQAVYFPNCNLWPNSPPAGPKLYGALEVYSRQAIDLYGNDPSKCSNMNWHGWGEDYFMQECMLTLGVPAAPDFNQVGDHRCIYAPCTDGSRVAFHDFKDIKSYNECFEQAIGGR